jgi:hypothetical protein
MQKFNILLTFRQNAFEGNRTEDFSHSLSSTGAHSTSWEIHVPESQSGIAHLINRVAAAGQIAFPHIRSHRCSSLRDFSILSPHIALYLTPWPLRSIPGRKLLEYAPHGYGSLSRANGLFELQHNKEDDVVSANPTQNNNASTLSF